MFVRKLCWTVVVERNTDILEQVIAQHMSEGWRIDGPQYDHADRDGRMTHSQALMRIDQVEV